MTPVVIERWLRIIVDGQPALIDDLLAEDAVFYSPAVFTPQVGKVKCGSYLRAAEKMFADSDFRFVGCWYAESSAILEFVAEIDGSHIEGIDMIHWNAQDKITSFKVMIRPLKGLQAVIPRMGELLGRPAAHAQPNNEEPLA